MNSLLCYMEDKKMCIISLLCVKIIPMSEILVLFLIACSCLNWSIFMERHSCLM